MKNFKMLYLSYNFYFNVLIIFKCTKYFRARRYPVSQFKPYKEPVGGEKNDVFSWLWNRVSRTT